MVRNITGGLFRIATLQEYFLVEIDNNEFLPELAAYCAKLEFKGFHITCVSRIYPHTNNTPRIAVLSTTEYKKAFQRLMSEENPK